eukprot:7454634-Karenia_brevis.AAC.1
MFCGAAPVGACQCGGTSGHEAPLMSRHCAYMNPQHRCHRGFPIIVQSWPPLCLAQLPTSALLLPC